MLSLRLSTMNRRISSGSGRFPLHKHVFYELIIPLKGAYKSALNGVELPPIPPGSVLLIQPGDMHEDYYEGGLDFIAVLFYLVDISGAQWSGAVLNKAAPPEEQIFPLNEGSDSELIFRLLARATPEKAGDPATILLRESLSESLFWSMVSDIPAGCFAKEFSKCLGADEFKLQVLGYFDRLPNSTSLDLDRMAAALSISRRTLFYKFELIFGKSPAKALMSWRITKAASLIESGLSVKAAADRTGFKTPSHFSRAFKQEFGFPPSELMSHVN